mgnify:CR=1 FL=1
MSLRLRPAARPLVPYLAIGEALVVVLVFGSSMVLVKAAVTHLGPVTVSALRYTLAALLLLPLALRRSGRAAFPAWLWTRLVLIGLSYYSEGSADGYSKAATAFQRAAEDPAWGAALDASGQEVLFLFLGNAYAKQAFFSEDDAAERQRLLAASQRAYEQAIARNANYPRSYNGLGGVFFQMARPLASNPDSCAWEWNLLDQAESAYTKALSLPAETKPPSGFVDLRAHMGLGRIHFWRGGCLDPAAWEQAQAEYTAAVAAYQDLDELDRSLLADQMAIAYTDLGHMAYFRALQPSTAADATAADPLLAEAILSYSQVITLAVQAGRDDLTKHAQQVMPYLLSAYCQSGQADAAHAVLDQFVSRTASPQASRAAILDQMQSATKKGCFDD